MSENIKIDGTTTIRDVIQRLPQAVEVFAHHGLPCAGCQVARYENIQQGAAAHGIALEPLLEDLRAVAAPRDRGADVLGPGKELHAAEESAEAAPSEGAEIKHIIAIASGKGGVGKSLVTGLLAVYLRRQGCRVGILDADITGPSIPRMFGLHRQLEGVGDKISPAETLLGIQVVSANLLLRNEDDPVVWRGPLVSGAIKQFYSETAWDDLDYLLVDLPPGTSDAPLTVFQTLPLDGVIVVSSPQLLAQMVVRKAARLAQELGVPILGVVENMSYVLCPDCDKPHEVFGPSRGRDLALALNAPFLGTLPIDPQLAQLCDQGRVESYHSDAYEALAEAFTEALANLPPRQKEEVVAR